MTASNSSSKSLSLVMPKKAASFSRNGSSTRCPLMTIEICCFVELRALAAAFRPPCGSIRTLIKDGVMLNSAPRLFVNEQDCKVTPTLCQQKSRHSLTFSKMGIDRESLFGRIMEAFGSRTAANLAEKLNITRQSVYGWRDGKNLPELEKLVEISNVTNTSLHWLLTGEGSKEIEGEKAPPSEAEQLLANRTLPEVFNYLLDRLAGLENEVTTLKNQKTPDTLIAIATRLDTSFTTIARVAMNETDGIDPELVKEIKAALNSSTEIVNGKRVKTGR